MSSSMTLKISLLLPLLAAAGAGALAQEADQPGGRKAGAAKVEAQSNAPTESNLRARARDLAEATADEAVKWDDKRAALRVLSGAADLLWEDNPERSRAWLTRAWDLTGEVTAEEEGNDTRRYRSNSPQAGDRAAVLAVAQRRDRELSERFLEQLTDEKEQSRHDSRRGIFDDRTARSEQLLNLALATVESDPAAAAALAERSIADGISFQLQAALLALRARDAAAADRVFDAALNRLSTGFAHASEGQVIASYLFTPGRVFGAGGGSTTALAVGTQTNLPPKTPAEADPARARRFLGVMQRVLLSMPVPSATADPSRSAQEFATLAGSLAAGFKHYEPELWLPVEQRLAQLIPDLAPARPDGKLPSSARANLASRAAAGADARELNRLYVDGLEAAAEKETDPLARKLAYVEAALATVPEELERGLGLAGRIVERDLRDQVISFLVYRAALLALEKGLLDEAVSLSSKAKPVQRAIVLVTAAQRIAAGRAGKSDAKALGLTFRALDLLSEAEKLLKQDDLPAEAVRVRLGLVAALATLDAPRALEAFGGVVAAVNRTGSFDPSDAAAPRVAGLDGFSARALLPRIRGGYGLKDAVTPLARADLEGSVMAAGKLSRPAVRGVCMLEIARAILTSRPDSGPSPRRPL